MDKFNAIIESKIVPVAIYLDTNGQYFDWLCCHSCVEYHSVTRNRCAVDDPGAAYSIFGNRRQLASAHRRISLFGRFSIDLLAVCHCK